MQLSQRFKRALETELRRLAEQQTNPSAGDGKNRIARRRARRRRAAQVQNPEPALRRHRGGGRAGEAVKVGDRVSVKKVFNRSLDRQIKAKGSRGRIAKIVLAPGGRVQGYEVKMPGMPKFFVSIENARVL